MCFGLEVGQLYLVAFFPLRHGHASVQKQNAVLFFRLLFSWRRYVFIVSGFDAQREVNTPQGASLSVCVCACNVSAGMDLMFGSWIICPVS